MIQRLFPGPVLFAYALVLVLCGSISGGSAIAGSPSRSLASSFDGGEAVVSLGMASGAPNVGFQFNKPSDHGSMVGGYLFLQNDKEKSGTKIQNRITSFGGHYKLRVFKNEGFSAHMSPGFGIHMVKDVTDLSATTAGKTTDVTAIGPTLRLGVYRDFQGKARIGLERLEIWNWMSEDTISNSAFYSFAVEIPL